MTVEGRILSGQQLINLRTKETRDVPTVGLKEFKPTNSWLEQKQIQNGLTERKMLLEEERIEKRSSLSTAVWLQDLKKAKVIKKVGKYWENMGHHVDDSDWLFPEEALLLLETNALELLYNDIPMSIERGYITLIDSETGCTLNEYRTYSHLVRLGYRLFRHLAEVTVTRYEKQIHLDQHVLNQKRTYTTTVIVDNNVDIVAEIPPKSTAKVPDVISIDLDDSQDHDIVEIDKEGVEEKEKGTTDMCEDDDDVVEVPVHEVVITEISDDSTESEETSEEEEDSDDSHSSASNWKRNSNTSVQSEEPNIVVRKNYLKINEFLIETNEVKVCEVIDISDDDNCKKGTDNSHREIEVIDIESDDEIPQPNRALIQLSKKEILDSFPSFKNGLAVVKIPDCSLIPSSIKPKHSEYHIGNRARNQWTNYKAEFNNINNTDRQRYGGNYQRPYRPYNRPRYPQFNSWNPWGMQNSSFMNQLNQLQVVATGMLQMATTLLSIPGMNNNQINQGFQRFPPPACQQNQPYQCVPYRQRYQSQVFNNFNWNNPSTSSLMQDQLQNNNVQYAVTQYTSQNYQNNFNSFSQRRYQQNTYQNSNNYQQTNLNQDQRNLNNSGRMLDLNASRSPTGINTERNDSRIDVVNVTTSTNESPQSRHASTPERSESRERFNRVETFERSENNGQRSRNRSRGRRKGYNQQEENGDQDSDNDVRRSYQNNSGFRGKRRKFRYYGSRKIRPTDESSRNEPSADQCVVIDTEGCDPAVFVDDIPVVQQSATFCNNSSDSFLSLNVTGERDDNDEVGERRNNRFGKFNRFQRNREQWRENRRERRMKRRNLDFGDVPVKRSNIQKKTIEVIDIIDAEESVSTVSIKSEKSTEEERRNGTTAERIKVEKEADPQLVVKSECITNSESAVPIKTEAPEVNVKVEKSAESSGENNKMDVSGEVSVKKEPNIKQEKDKDAPVQSSSCTVSTDQTAVVKVEKQSHETNQCSSTEATEIKEEPSSSEIRKECDSVPVESQVNLPSIQNSSSDTSQDQIPVGCWAQLKQFVPEAVPNQKLSTKEQEKENQNREVDVCSSSSSSSDGNIETEDMEQVQPIITPNDCKSYESVLSALQIIGPADLTNSSLKKLKISFDVYVPNVPFKKSSRGLPNYRLIVTSFRDPVPNPRELSELTSRFEDGVPILIAVVLPDSVSFYQVATVDIGSSTNDRERRS